MELGSVATGALAAAGALLTIVVALAIRAGMSSLWVAGKRVRRRRRRDALRRESERAARARFWLDWSTSHDRSGPAETPVLRPARRCPHPSCAGALVPKAHWFGTWICMSCQTEYTRELAADGAEWFSRSGGER